MASTVEELFRSYSQKAGDVARQLAFAGLAIIWLIHTSTIPEGSAPTAKIIDAVYHCPLKLFVVCLGVDAAQYLLGSVLWGWLFYKGKSTEEANKHCIAVSIPSLLIVIKLFLLLIAYWKLFDVLQVKLLIEV